MPVGKRFVYVLRSVNEPSHFYVGLASDVDDRLADHNSGKWPSPARWRPWRQHVVTEFADQLTAARFDRYLKSGSGRAFSRRHFQA